MANAWFMRPKIDRSGRVHEWEHDPGVTLDDLARMDRLTEAIPRVVSALTPADRPGDQTQWMSSRWFER